MINQAVLGAIGASRPVSSGGSGSDPSYSNVSLLLHCNGSNNSTTFTDNSPLAQTVTAAGNAKITTAASFFNGSSGVLDGSGSYLSVPAGAAFNFGAGDFTLECFVSFTSFKTYNALFCNNNNDATGFLTRYRHEGNGFFYVESWDAAGNGYSQFVFLPALLTLNTPYYFALVKNGSAQTLRFYLNGTLIGGENATTGYFRDCTAPFLFGRDATNTSRDLDANIGEIRVTKGVARSITSTPNSPFPDS